MSVVVLAETSDYHLLALACSDGALRLAAVGGSIITCENWQ